MIGNQGMFLIMNAISQAKQDSQMMNINLSNCGIDIINCDVNIDKYIHEDRNLKIFNISNNVLTSITTQG